MRSVYTGDYRVQVNCIRHILGLNFPSYLLHVNILVRCTLYTKHSGWELKAHLYISHPTLHTHYKVSSPFKYMYIHVHVHIQGTDITITSHPTCIQSTTTPQTTQNCRLVKVRSESFPIIHVVLQSIIICIYIDKV